MQRKRCLTYFPLLLHFWVSPNYKVLPPRPTRAGLSNFSSAIFSLEASSLAPDLKRQTQQMSLE